jgi:hypothetical protein
MFCGRDFASVSKPPPPASAGLLIFNRSRTDGGENEENEPKHPAKTKIYEICGLTMFQAKLFVSLCCLRLQ